MIQSTKSYSIQSIKFFVPLTAKRPLTRSPITIVPRAIHTTHPSLSPDVTRHRVASDVDFIRESYSWKMWPFLLTTRRMTGRMFNLKIRKMVLYVCMYVWSVIEYVYLYFGWLLMAIIRLFRLCVCVRDWRVCATHVQWSTVMLHVLLLKFGKYTDQ